VIRIPADLSARLGQAVRAAQEADALPAFDVPTLAVERPKKREHGDYASPTGMQLARLAGLAPLEVAGVLVAHFPETDYLSEISVAPNGFINFRLSDDWLRAQVDAILEAGSAFADLPLNIGRRAQVECVSANPTGPLTVGRVRGGVIGDTLARLLSATGYRVELEYYFNNAGRQMRVLGESLRARYLERLGRPSEFPPDGYQGDYLYDIAARLIEERSDALAEEEDVAPFTDFAEAEIFESIRSSLKRINIVFDYYFNENSLYESGAVWETLDRLEADGWVYRAVRPEADQDADAAPDADELEAIGGDGVAVWLKTRQLRGTKRDRALVKSSGEPTYRLPDIAYHINKLERGFDLAVNILGADHIEEFKDVKAGLRALGYDDGKVQVIIHQFVTLTQSGQTVRMSTRKGEFVTLDELVDEVGPDAVRFFMLYRSADSHMDFDLDLAKEQSNENPVYYIQNAHVRCAGIARVAEERGVSMDGSDISLLTDPRELALLRKMIELPEVVEYAVSNLAPHHLAFYAVELARVFHPTYDEVRALHQDVPLDVAKARLRLFAAARIVFARALELMGMSAPDVM
jgi:arginyl-tRNA synthetase